METEKSHNVFMTLIKVGLICYTMIRSIDLVMSTLPDSIKTFAILVVFGLDVALLAWDNYTADPRKARSESQHNVGVVLIVGNMLGIGAAVIADSARILDPVGSRDLIYYVSIYGIAVVLLANIAGLIAVNQLDPDRAEAQANAAHVRKIAAMEKEHDRKMALADKQTELDVAAFRNMKRIKDARKRYYLDDLDDGDQPNRPAAEPGMLDKMKAGFSKAFAPGSGEVTTYADDAPGEVVTIAPDAGRKNGKREFPTLEELEADNAARMREWERQRNERQQKTMVNPPKPKKA